MKKTFITSLICLLTLSIVSCGKKTPKNYSYKITFVEQEQYVDPYPTRVIVSPEYVRFDDGDTAQDYVLFDRLKNIVYSVVHEEQTVMSVHHKPRKVESPIKLTLSEKALGVMKDAPSIAGEKPNHYQLLVNDKVCTDIVTVKGLLPAAVTALKDFSVLMASDSKVTLSSTPADMLSPCDLANDTFEPSRLYKFGFPVQTMGRRNYVRTLVDFDDKYKADKKLFELPKDFKRYSVQELREGKVKFKD